MFAPGLPTSRRFVTQLLNSLSAPSHAPDGAGEPSNPLRDLPEAARKQLISLQVLFPNEFVPALDLLDRRLVTKFRVRNGQEIDAPVSAAVEESQVHDDAAASARNEDLKETGNAAQNPSIPQHEGDGTETSNPAPSIAAPDHAMPDTPTSAPPLYTVYYVRSAQQRTSRYSTSYDTTTTYEVRLRAWNCSCPAFAFAAFPAVHPEPPVLMYDPVEVNSPLGHASHGVEDEWVFGGVSLDDGMPRVCKHLLACVLVEKCSVLFGGFLEERDVSIEEAAGWAAGWGD